MTSPVKCIHGYHVRPVNPPSCCCYHRCKYELWKLMCDIYQEKKQEDGKCFDPLYLRLREQHDE